MAAILVVASALTTAMQPAHADPTVPDLAFVKRQVIPSFSCQVVLDESHDRFFISERNAGQVEAFGYDGSSLAAVPATTPCGMVLLGSTLYVAEIDAGRIRRIDTTTMTDQGVLASDLGNPFWLAWAGGRLWTGSSFGGRLISVGLDGTVASYDYPSEQQFGYRPVIPMFATSPLRPGELYVGDAGSSDPTVLRLDVSGPAPALLESTTVGTSGASGITDIALTPDGSRLLVAKPSGAGFFDLNASTLVDDGVQYHAGLGFASGIAVSAAYGGLVATTRDGEQGHNLYVERLGQPGPVVALTTMDRAAMRRGLALTSDANVLVAMGPHWLEIWAGGEQGPVPTTTTVTASPSIGTYSRPTTFTASVAPIGTGHITFTADGSISPIPGCLLVPVDSATGTASCVTSQLDAGTHRIDAQYTADPSRHPSSGGLDYTVLRAPTELAAGPPVVQLSALRINPLGVQARLTSFGTALANRSVVIRAGSTVLCAAVTDGNGLATCPVPANAVVPLVLSGGSYEARFDGDPNHLESTATANALIG